MSREIIDRNTHYKKNSVVAYIIGVFIMFTYPVTLNKRLLSIIFFRRKNKIVCVREREIIIYGTSEVSNARYPRYAIINIIAQYRWG